MQTFGETMIMHYLLKMIDWLNPLAHMLGLAVSIWAYRRSLKRGYLVVALYFALAVFSLLVTPKINRLIAERRSPDLSEQAQERMHKAVLETMERVEKEEGEIPMGAVTRNVNFPLGPILLVVGLWLIARRERVTEHRNPELSPAAVAPDEA